MADCEELQVEAHEGECGGSVSVSVRLQSEGERIGCG